MNENHWFMASTLLYCGWAYASWVAGNRAKAGALGCYAAANIFFSRI